MKRMKFFILILVFGGCALSQNELSNLKHKTMSYYELPLEVQKYLLNPPEQTGEIYNALVLINSSDSLKFSFETKGTFIGP